MLAAVSGADPHITFLSPAAARANLESVGPTRALWRSALASVPSPHVYKCLLEAVLFSGAMVLGWASKKGGDPHQAHICVLRQQGSNPSLIHPPPQDLQSSFKCWKGWQGTGTFAHRWQSCSLTVAFGGKNFFQKKIIWPKRTFQRLTPLCVILAISPNYLIVYTKIKRSLF